MRPTNNTAQPLFLDLPSSLEPAHARAIATAREVVTIATAQLKAFADEVRGSDYNAEGKLRRSREALTESVRHITSAFAPASNLIESHLGTAQRGLHGRLTASVDRPERVAAATQGLAWLLAADPPPAKFPVAEGTGHALLPAAGSMRATLADLIRSGPLDDARVVFLAAARCDPVTRFRLGGTAVIDALEHELTLRVVAEDAQAAGHAADIDMDRGVLGQIRSDIVHAVEAAANALALPREAARHLITPDPIKTAAGK